MEFAESAFRHGFTRSAIEHAVVHAVGVFDLEPDADPPKVVAIGVDPAGRWLEIIWLELPDADVVIHAMRLRKVFARLLESGDGDG